MAKIIAIESSGRVCSAALIDNGVCAGLKEFIPEPCAQMEHSAMLAPFIDELLREQNWSFAADVDAIAVSAGPGSYTGLRIGISTAKGLCLGGNKKMILVDSLLSLVNVAIARHNFDSHTTLCPMVDARRMEVYCAMYDKDGNRLTDIKPVVVDNTTFVAKANEKVVVFGSGAQKCLDPMRAAGVQVTMVDIDHSATGLALTAQSMFDRGQFADIAYCEPLYLKEFVGTQPKVNGR